MSSVEWQKGSREECRRKKRDEDALARVVKGREMIDCHDCIVVMSDPISDPTQRLMLALAARRDAKIGDGVWSLNVEPLNFELP